MMATLKALRHGLTAVIAVGCGTGHCGLTLERHVVLRPHGTSRAVRGTPALAGVSLRAKTTACDADARLSVALDGVRVLSTQVSNTNWRRYQARLSVPAGRHTFAISYPAAAHMPQRSCRRVIQVSDVTLVRAARRPPVPTSHAAPSAPSAGPTPGLPGSSGATIPAAPPPAAQPAATPWSGDFSTGDLSQWRVLSSDALPGRITVGPRPGVTGAYAGRFEIGADDPSPDPTDPGQQRAEVRATQVQSRGYSGTEVWYGWSVYFPDPGFTSPAENPNQAHPQTFFTQWKRTGGHCGSPNVFFEVSSPTRPGFYLGVQGGTNTTNQGSSANCPGTVYHSYRLGDFTPGRWCDFVFHVKWSSDPTVGFVQAWIDGTKVLPKTYEATLYRDWNASTDYGSYLRQGELRIASPGNSSVIYIAGTRVGSSYTAVAPHL